MQTISWNYKGLGNLSKADAIKDLLKMAPSDLVLLKETKIDEKYLLMLSKFKWHLNAGKAVSARGTFGGLVTLWSSEKFQ